MLLMVSLLGLALVLNALRPPRMHLISIPAFFAAWLVVELAPYVLVLHVVGVAVLFALVGPSPAAWGGLAVALVTAALLGWMIRQAQHVDAVANVALAQWPEVGPPAGELPSGVRRFFPSMAFQDPVVERVKDIAYGEAGKRHLLDVYRRKDRPTGCPTLVQVHGGGWVIGEKGQQGRPLMLEMVRRGWVCIAPNYRLSPRATFPEHLIDVKQVIAWVREHGQEYGADPGFLVLTGGSAGGHLSALAALTPNDPAYQPGFEDVDTSVQGCVPFYGVYDFEGETDTNVQRVRHERLLTGIVMKTRDPEAYRAASPIARAHADAPAFLVVHGRNDTLVPVEEARLLVERLQAVSQQPVLYLELPGAEHAFEVFPSVRTEAVVRAVARFLETLRATAPARGR